jgi:hypothetical protein
MDGKSATYRRIYRLLPKLFYQNAILFHELSSYCCLSTTRSTTLETTMDGVSEYQHPQIPGPAQLEIFAKLPLELRLLIWEYLFRKIYTTPHVLSILRCSRYLYQEIADHLYRGMRHEIRMSFTDNSLKRLYVRLVSKNMSANGGD